MSCFINYFITYIHTYIPLMLCALILYVSGGIDRLTSTPKDRFFRNFFMAGLFYTQSFCQKSAEWISPKKYIFFHTRNDLISFK